MFNLVLYDTSNFEDFPIGGQLTSIRNFLRYIAVCNPDYGERILLVGVTTDASKVGEICKIEIENLSFAFLPVLHRQKDLAQVKKSLRLEYVQALLRYKKKIPDGRNIVHYLHTPEAYIAVRLIHPFARVAVFSHGSFFNMVSGFRFFQKNKGIHVLFNQFLILLLKTADLVFALDDDSFVQYTKYSKHVYRVNNSIQLPEAIPDRLECHKPVRLLFVGRLSKVKRVEQIISAVARMKGWAELTIVGDGEERESLESLVRELDLQDSVKLPGAFTPEQTKQFYSENDVLIINSIIEGKPMVILEALSYGMPVITTPVGGIPELVRDGIEAEYTDGTPEKIVEKLRYVTEKYEYYANNAISRSKLYDYKTVNEEIVEVISQLR